MYVIVGYCPRCGAPIYTYDTWNATVPPPIVKTCSCFSKDWVYENGTYTSYE